MKKVSVIVPIYNGEKFVLKFVDNIKKQNYTNIELILVDDGSTDNTWEIIKKCKNEIDNVITIRQRNQGVSVARNNGLRKATGDYVIFVDVDDDFEVNYISKFVQVANENNAEVVLCNYNEIYSNNEIIKKTLPWKNKILYNEEIRNILVKKMLISGEDNIKGLVWRTFIKKELLDKINLKFIPGIKLAEDLLFCIELFSNCKKIYILEDYLYNYHIYSNSSLNRYYENYIYDQEIYYENLKKILKRNDLFNKYENIYLKENSKIYSYCISNAIRSNDFHKINSEIDLIRIKVKNNKEIKQNASKLNKIVYTLLIYNMKHLIITIYTAKEKIRKRKYMNR